MSSTTYPGTARPTWRAALADRRLIGHYLQMLVAMGVGTVVLGELSMHLVHHAGAEAEALLMATAMVAGMAVWMLLRGDRTAAIAEAAVACYAAFAVLLPFLWLGALTPSGLMALGHVLMLPATAIAVLHRREDHISAR